MLNTLGAPTQMSAVVLSMGIEVMENNPRSKPNCKAMSRALNATARIPGRKRCRSYHMVANEYGIDPLQQNLATEDTENTEKSNNCLSVFSVSSVADF
jgi:hypothetical protein